MSPTMSRMDVVIRLRPPLLAAFLLLAASIALNLPGSPAPLAQVPDWYGDHARPPIAITGQVLDGSGDITIAMFLDRQPTHEWSIRIPAAPDGTFRTPPLPRGRYRLVAYTPTHMSRAVLIDTFFGEARPVDVFLHLAHPPYSGDVLTEWWAADELWTELEHAHYLLGHGPSEYADYAALLEAGQAPARRRDLVSELPAEERVTVRGRVTLRGKGVGDAHVTSVYGGCEGSDNFLLGVSDRVGHFAIEVPRRGTGFSDFAIEQNYRFISVRVTHGDNDASFELDRDTAGITTLEVRLAPGDVLDF